MPVRTLKDEYLATWQGVLSQLGGWDQGRVLSWIKNHEQDLNDPNSMIFHETPLYWVVPSLVAESIQHNLSHEQWIRLLDALLNVFGEDNVLFLHPNTDWAQYKERINSVLDQYHYAAIEVPVSKEPIELRKLQSVSQSEDSFRNTRLPVKLANQLHAGYAYA